VALLSQRIQQRTMKTDRNAQRQKLAGSKPASQLPETGFLRQAQIIPAIFPVSSATWWRWVTDGKAPKPVKLSERVTAWRAEDIRALCESFHAAAK
jgi:predicted DNA-binding transcriptional regulator AlpA